MSKLRTVTNIIEEKKSKYKHDNIIVYIKGFDNYSEDELVKCYSEMKGIYLELAELGLSNDVQDTLRYETWLSGE